ncbi:MAG: hypothetical protein V3U21_06110 [Thermodesulfobacteriota bacterium]
MNLKQIALLIIIATVPLLYSCSGSGSGPGYLFQIILIVVPLFIIGHYLHKKIESANESLYVIEGQLRKLTTRIEAIEEKLNEKTSAKRTKK